MELELSRDDLLRVVDDCVTELLDAAQPPIDALALAARLRLPLDLDPELTPLQRQAAAALAVGTHLKPHLLQRLGIDPTAPRQMMGQSLPRLFAEHLLVPACCFRDDVRAAAGDLSALVQRYASADPELVALRLLDLPEPCVVTVFEDDVVRQRKSNGPRITKKPQAVERDCYQWIVANCRPHSLRRDGWSVQGWLIESAGRARVILRSFVEEETGG